MELLVYFHSNDLKVSGKSFDELFNKAFNEVLSRQRKKLIIERKDELSLVKNHLFNILNNEWFKILRFSEVDKFSSDYLTNFEFREEAFEVLVPGINQELKPNVKIISFDSVLSTLLRDFISKVLEE